MLMPKSIYNMSDEEIEQVIDDFFDKTPKKVLIDIFEKAGFFEEFKPEEIKWEVFLSPESGKDENSRRL